MAYAGMAYIVMALYSYGLDLVVGEAVQRRQLRMQPLLVVCERARHFSPAMARVRIYF